ncbi:MAG: precorrin-6y C5,15-methyltransferase (decarboxylating) subunit CbiE [Pirellulaceae bacterium]|jgi:precorrin-6Y C5,15-methyltransferase (decarboxylating)|nr:cobalamin biosynthesis bifunctional protein CbiET [Planctomycetota bacterium]MDP6557938.1 precorrin-6y C5,15-methyltransferase (decarboxylating) subunit CbiE [Pirellulaceae bacterium]
MTRRNVTVIGIGDDGCVGLSSRAAGAVARCQVLAGGERQLDFFPQFEGQRVVFKNGLMAAVGKLIDLADENTICVLASGDPMFFGVGSVLTKKFGTDRIEIIPQPSSIQQAFARVGRSWNDAAIISLHGKPLEGLTTRLKRTPKAAVLTDDKNTPSVLARHMIEYGETDWRAWVCEQLCGPNERITAFATLDDLSAADGIGDLNVLVLERTDPNWNAAPVVLNLHEDEFAKRMPRRGLITKKEVRLLSIGELFIRPADVIWDIGAASGSIAIEAAAIASEGRAYAIEMEPESLAFCRENLRTHGVDNVRVVEGQAPQILEEISDDPNAVFVGGSKGKLDQIIEVVWKRLKPGGRLVVNAITLENVAQAYQTFKGLQIQPAVMQINIARGAPIAAYTRYDALTPVHIFSAVKDSDSPQRQK